MSEHISLETIGCDLGDKKSAACVLRDRRKGPGSGGGADEEGGNDEVFHASSSARRDRGGSPVSVGERVAQEARSRRDNRKSQARGADLAERQQKRPHRCGALELDWVVRIRPCFPR